MTVHVITASKHESTREIGEAIARRLRDRGHQAVAEAAETLGDSRRASRSSMSVEALLAGMYAAMLLAIAAGIDRLARHSHHRSSRYRTAGFQYRRDLDVWECPEGEHLKGHETDHDRRLVRYRARPRLQ